MHSNQKHPGIFYGWWVVASSFLIAVYTGGVVFFGFTAVFEPIANEFGWSYAQVSLASSLNGLEMGLLAPLAGILVDRWGPRRLVLGGVFLVGTGLLLLSRTSSLAMFYGAFFLIASGLGTCSVTVLMAAVVNWFRDKVAMAIGITASGWGFAGILVSVVTVLVDTLGWRTATVVFGLGMWGIGIPLAFLIRSNPEPFGQLADSKVSTPQITGEETNSTPVTVTDAYAKQAVKSWTFWHISLSLMCHSIIMSAVITHVMPYLASVGIARSVSSLVASATPVASVLGRLGFGWLGSRHNNKHLTIIGLTLVGAGLLFFGLATSETMWLLVPFILLFGTGWGSIATMRSVLVREYFGRSRFGSIHGFVVGIMLLGHMVGAPLAGWVFDSQGSYRGIWLAFVGLAIAAIVIMLTTPRVELKN